MLDRRCSNSARSADPAPFQAPQLMQVAGSPLPRRAHASESSNALAAAWFACPGAPRTEAMDEKIMKKSSLAPAVNV